MRSWLGSAALGALIALLVCAGLLLIWTLLTLPFLRSFEAIGLGFAEIWWAPTYMIVDLPQSSAAWAFAGALAAVAMLGAALALLLRWRDPDRKLLSAVRWSLRAWTSAWPWSALMLAVSLALLLFPEAATLHRSVYVLAIPALLLLWMGCLHPAVLRTERGSGWWRPRLPPGKRLLAVIVLLLAGFALTELADELLGGSVALLTVEVMDAACMLAATMTIVSIGRTEHIAQIMRQVLSPTVLPRWLLLYAIAMACAAALFAPALMLAFAGNHLVPQAQEYYSQLTADAPASIGLIRLLAQSELSTWLPLLAALLPFGILCEGRLLTLAMDWQERGEPRGPDRG